MALEHKNKDHTNCYECCDFDEKSISKVYVSLYLCITLNLLSLMTYCEIRKKSHEK